jgi:hypothetical protein
VQAVPTKLVGLGHGIFVLCCASMLMPAGLAWMLIRELTVAEAVAMIPDQ